MLLQSLLSVSICVICGLKTLILSGLRAKPALVSNYLKSRVFFLQLLTLQIYQKLISIALYQDYSQDQEYNPQDSSRVYGLDRIADKTVMIQNN